MTELNGIPILFERPQAFLISARDQAVELLQRLAFDANQTAALTEQKNLAPATTARLQQVAAALKFNREILTSLFKPLLEHPLLPSSTGHAAALASGLNHSRNDDLSSNFTNVFRDWSWTENETAEHLKILSSFLPEGKLGRVLILGAGSARLAHDLAKARDCSEIVATEINPLLFLIAKKIVDGESLELFEIAELPASSESAVAKRVLKKPVEQTTPNVKSQSAHNMSPVKLVFDNFHSSGLDAESFDLVITPWFVDVVGLRLSETAARVNGLLKSNGRWINFGPLMFQTASRAELLTFEEAKAEASKPEIGFEIESSKNFQLTQLKSELSATFRTDSVFGWSARKISSATIPTAIKREAPCYFKDFKSPITLSDELKALDLEEISQSHQLLSEVLKGCYEKKSVMQIAQALAPDFELPVETIVPLVVDLIQKFYRSKTGDSLPSV